MANRPHVPKFGDWNNQDQPFTTVFDNARTNKKKDLYESLEKLETKPQPPKPIPPPPQPQPPKPTAPPPQPPKPTAPPPQPAPRASRPEPPKPPRDERPRATPPTDRANRVQAPPTDVLYGGGLYGGYGGGGSSAGSQRPPSRHVQPKYNPRGGNNGRGGTTIPPFPGSLGAGENMSYTHIFEKVKEERNRDGGRPYGGSSNNTPSRPMINGPEPTRSAKICCFPWSSK